MQSRGELLRECQPACIMPELVLTLMPSAHPDAAIYSRRNYKAMCLAIPSKIIRTDGQTATIDVAGVQRQTSLMLVEDVQVGDYVIVHAGFAIQKLDAAAARETLELLRQAVAIDDDPPH
jgi:hydrogenase expression/formation protein HypC